MPTKTRREKIAAIAKTAEYNPEEAAVAQAMLDKLPATLDDIATDIMSAWSKGIEAEFQIGHLLRRAAALMDPKARDKDEQGRQTAGAFSRWFKEQNFPFSMKTAYRLREAAEREPEVRAYLAARNPDSRDMGVNTAITLMLSKPKAPTADVGPTTPADPAYAALRDAAYLILGDEGDPKNAFLTMHVDDLAACAGWIKHLAGAYNEAKAERQAK